MVEIGVVKVVLFLKFNLYVEFGSESIDFSDLFVSNL